MNFMMGLMNLIGGIFNKAESDFGNFKWLYPIAKFLDSLLIPMIIVLAMVGVIWVVWIGVNIAKAEDAGKAEEQKKRLINVAIAIVAVIIFVFLLAFVANNISTWLTNDNQIFTTSAFQTIVR